MDSEFRPLKYSMELLSDDTAACYGCQGFAPSGNAHTPARQWAVLQQALASVYWRMRSHSNAAISHNDGNDVLTALCGGVYPFLAGRRTSRGDPSTTGPFEGALLIEWRDPSAKENLLGWVSGECQGLLIGKASCIGIAKGPKQFRTRRVVQVIVSWSVCKQCHLGE